MEQISGNSENHTCAPRSKIYLADGYDIVRRYTNNLEIEEDFVNPKRGILILYALPDTAALGMSEAQAYAIIWDAFQQIQNAHFPQWFTMDRKLE